MENRYSINITYRWEKGFDEVRAERTCPQWEDLAGFKVSPAVDLLCDFGPQASLSENPCPTCKLPVLYFSTMCPRACTEERSSDTVPELADSTAAYTVVPRANGW